MNTVFYKCAVRFMRDNLKLMIFLRGSPNSNKCSAALFLLNTFMNQQYQHDAFFLRVCTVRYLFSFHQGLWTWRLL